MIGSVLGDLREAFDEAVKTLNHKDNKIDLTKQLNSLLSESVASMNNKDVNGSNKVKNLIKNLKKDVIKKYNL